MQIQYINYWICHLQEHELHPRLTPIQFLHSIPTDNKHIVTHMLGPENRRTIEANKQLSFLQQRTEARQQKQMPKSKTWATAFPSKIARVAWGRGWVLEVPCRIRYARALQRERKLLCTLIKWNYMRKTHLLDTKPITCYQIEMINKHIPVLIKFKHSTIQRGKPAESKPITDQEHAL